VRTGCAERGISPFQALFGRQMTVGFDLSLLKEFESASNIQAYAADLALFRRT